MSTENGSAPFGERELASRLGTGATLFQENALDASCIEKAFDSEPLVAHETIEASIAAINAQIAHRYTNSSETRETLIHRTGSLLGELAARGIDSWDGFPAEMLLQWCNRNIRGGGVKRTQKPSAKTVTNRMSAARQIVKAAFDAGLIDALRRDELLTALSDGDDRSGSTQGSTRTVRGRPAILSGSLAAHSDLAEEELQRIITEIRELYREQPGALAEREGRARVFLRWTFGHIVKSWEEFSDQVTAEQLVRYWEGRFMPVRGVPRPSLRSPQATASRRRAVAAVMDAAVKLGCVDADHETVLASHQRRGLGFADTATDAESIAIAVDSWYPKGWSQAELRALKAVRPTVREWVTKTGPSSVKEGRDLMREVARHTVSVYRRDDNLDPEHVLHEKVIEYRIENELKGRAWSTNRTTRSRLRLVGRTVAPAVSLPLPKSAGKVEPQKIYNDIEESAFRDAAELDWPTNPAARMWLVAATLGAGLTGVEAEVLGPADVHRVGHDRLMIDVAGRNPRRVPIRADYTDLARKAVALADGERFIESSGYGSASRVATQIHVNGTGSLSLPRARATWIVAHLRADVSQRAFRRYSGPVHHDTLDRLMRQAADEMDDLDAVLKGLSA